MYKKSYTGFVWWMVGFVAVLFAICFLPVQDEALLMRLIMLLMAWGVASMAFIIWKTEYVYWYNGTSFEEAKAADSERRKAFAWKHLRVFGLYALGTTVIVVLMHLLGWSAWIDFTAATIGLVVAACMTVPFKL